ncbi:MAG: hypothetical protein ABSH49_27980, partial [Bryobacteraceae bacterium]
MAMERRTFHGPDIDIPALAQALADKFSHDGYETQTLQTPNGLTVQIRKEEMLRKIAGMSSALTVVMAMEGEYVAVEIGGAKWADKGVAAGVGAIIFFGSEREFDRVPDWRGFQDLRSPAEVSGCGDCGVPASYCAAG